MTLKEVKEAMNKAHRCSKCKSEVKLEEVQTSCTCGAEIHYKQTCLKCGFVTYIHRFIKKEPLKIGG